MQQTQTEIQIAKPDIEGFSVEAADEPNQIMDGHHKHGQWYLALTALVRRIAKYRDRGWLWKWR